LPSHVNNKCHATNKAEIAYGIENATKMGIKWHSIVRHTADICSDYKGPQIFVNTNQLGDAIKE